MSELSIEVRVQNLTTRLDKLILDLDRRRPYFSEEELRRRVVVLENTVRMMSNEKNNVQNHSNIEMYAADMHALLLELKEQGNKFSSWGTLDNVLRNITGE